MFDSHDLDSTKAMRGDEDKIGNNEGAGSNDNDGVSGDKGTNTQNVSLQQSRLRTHREYNATPPPQTALLPTTLLPSPFPI